MKDELITFETAKLAKEKLFDVATEYYYYLDEGLKRHRLYNRNKFINQWTAPTQSLLQRWLREKHKIFLTVEYSLEKDDWFFYLYKQSFNEYTHFKTYELALEAGLQKGLKFINK